MRRWLSIKTRRADKGLKGGALGFVSSVVVGVASTAPAYSLAATLGFVVIAINGLQTPDHHDPRLRPDAVHLLRLQGVELRRPRLRHHVHLGDPRLRPQDRVVGGWGIVAADILVMASLAQVAADYVFLLFGADGIGATPTSGWVLLVGVGWIVVMTAICYVGIEISANFQKVLLRSRLTMLLVLSVVALTRSAPDTHPRVISPPRCRGSTRSTCRAPRASWWASP